MANTILTQGTEIFCFAPSALDSETKVVFKIEGASEFNPGDETADEIPTTDLAERKAHTFVTGLTDPGEASITLQVNPKNPKHKLLYDLRAQALEFAVGWSDGIAPATLNEGGTAMVLPDDRTWFKFSGSIKSFPFDFTSNSVVKATMSIRRSGAGVWTPKDEA